MPAPATVISRAGLDCCARAALDRHRSDPDRSRALAHRHPVLRKPLEALRLRQISDQTSSSGVQIVVLP